jgi:hypothetical protein
VYSRVDTNVSEVCTASIFRAGDSAFFQNVVIYVLFYTALKPMHHQLRRTSNLIRTELVQVANQWLVFIIRVINEIFIPS